MDGQEYAIGFGDASERVRSRTLANKLAIDFGDGCISPETKHYIDGSYKALFGPLYLYVNEESLSRSEVRIFLRYFMENARPIVGRAGYIPYSRDQYLEFSAPLFE